VNVVARCIGRSLHKVSLKLQASGLILSGFASFRLGFVIGFAICFFLPRGVRLANGLASPVDYRRSRRAI
jgi:hypothetical protein